MEDLNYIDPPRGLTERPHSYGPNFHLLGDPYLFSVLSNLCDSACVQPVLHWQLTTLYRGLLQAAVNSLFPLVRKELQTRMFPVHEQARYQADILDPSTKVVCVNLARAGTVPSQVCFEMLHSFLSPGAVRQDHLSMNRQTNAREEVTGVQSSGIKIGGPIEDRILIIPDPMGATGSTIESTLNIYREIGQPKAVIALHLIVTPEYLQRVTALPYPISVFALRCDRGLSESTILDQPLGKTKAAERGLNAKHYIVPGAGGLGELINNAEK